MIRKSQSSFETIEMKMPANISLEPFISRFKLDADVICFYQKLPIRLMRKRAVRATFYITGPDREKLANLFEDRVDSELELHGFLG